MAPFLFVTDLDNTLVGNDAALTELNRRLAQHRQEHGTRIVYATGRSLSLYQQLKIEKELLEPDALVLSVGTVIYHQGSEVPDPGWSSKLSQNWDREQVTTVAASFTELTPQPASEQGTFKVSYYLAQAAAPTVLPQLEEQLKAQGLDIRLVYSSGQDLDVLPRHGNKGTATAFLRDNFGMLPARTVVCGDSGNDIALFEAGDGYGIIVGNAQPELLDWHQTNPSEYRYLASAHCAGGILEGLQALRFLK